MRCPKCGGVAYPYVSRTTDTETYRLYDCKRCKSMFCTREVVDQDVTTNNGYFKKLNKGENND